MLNLFCEDMMNKTILEKLKGCRTSKNRDDVINILKKQESPISVEDIFNELKFENEKLSLSTVYRIVEKLTSLNVVRKAAVLDDNKSLYELVKDGHNHYMICVKCKKMIPIDGCPIEELEKKIATDTGFNITGHKFELYGECQSCIDKEKGVE